MNIETQINGKSVKKWVLSLMDRNTNWRLLALLLHLPSIIPVSLIQLCDIYPTEAHMHKGAWLGTFIEVFIHY